VFINVIYVYCLLYVAYNEIAMDYILFVIFSYMRSTSSSGVGRQVSLAVFAVDTGSVASRAV